MYIWCIYAYMCESIWMDVGRHECMYTQIDGYRQNCMNSCMCTHVYTYMHTECNSWQCPSIKLYINDHRYERINIAAK